MRLRTSGFIRPNRKRARNGRRYRAASRLGVMAVVTDIRPLPGGAWLAMCECGLEQLVPDRDAAWDWLLEHQCNVIDLEAEHASMQL